MSVWRGVSSALILALGLALPAGALAEPAKGGPSDELSELLGEELASELAEQEERITGRKGDRPAYLAAPSDGEVAAVGGGGIGSSRLMNPALSLIVDAVGGYASDRKIALLRSREPGRTMGFEVAESEFGVEAAIDPYFYLKGYFAFGFDSFATEEVYAETLRMPGGFKLRIGQMLAAFGRKNPSHAHTWAFVDAPLPNQRFFSPEGLRASSLEASWVMPLPVFTKLTLAGAMPGAEAPGTHPDELTFAEGEDEDFLYLVRLETFLDLSDTWSLNLGGSALVGPSGRGDEQSRVYGGDLFLRYKPVQGHSYTELSLQGEFLLRERDFASETVRDWGAYLESKLRLSQRTNVSLRGDMASGDLLRGAEGGSFLDLTEERVALAFTVIPSEFSLLRVQANLGHPHGGVWDGPEWVHEVFLQLDFSAGAHGAHGF